MKKLKKIFSAIGSFFKRLGKKIKGAFLYLRGKWQGVNKVRLAFIINTAFAIFNGVLAFLEASVWFLMLCIYYMSMALVRGGIVAYQKRQGRGELAQLKAYERCGGFLILISLALCVAVIQMIYINRSFKYTGLIIYAVATFAFYKIILAIINIVRFKQESDYSVRCVMNINLANALVSILALQTALLNEFSTGEVDGRIFNGLTGGFVCAFILGLGIYMLARAKKKLKAMKENKNGRI